VAVNFGAIFDTSNRMRMTIFIFFLVFGLAANGQSRRITEFDLYGHWILDLTKIEQDESKLIYKRHEASNMIVKKEESAIYFQAFEECEIATYRPFICGNEAPPPDYSWTFEKTRASSIFIVLKNG